MAQTDENLKIAFASESQTNIEYLAYAHKAIDEGLMEIAQLFREAAGAEIVHALSHLKAMGVVGRRRRTSERQLKGKAWKSYQCILSLLRKPRMKEEKKLLNLSV